MSQPNQYGIIDRKGQEFYNNFGSLMIVSKYRNSKDIDLYFPEYDWTFYHADIRNIQKGNIKCPYEPRNRNIGYIGEGPFLADKTTVMYRTWNNMITRCYDEKQRLNNLKYQDCYINEYFHCYQNYGQWFINNYYEIPNETMCLDKDILIKGNKEYGPNTCCFVPKTINNLFTLSNNARNNNLPIGVKLEGKKYYARPPYRGCSMKGFKGQETPEEAFYIYKEIKENHIKNIAEQYKDYIPDNLYQALISWQIEITD